MSVHKNDGKKMGPNGPEKKEARLSAKEPGGKPAGGLENMKADGQKMRSAAKSVPENGSAKFRPAGVKVVSGLGAVSAVASKPAGKTKSPQNAT